MVGEESLERRAYATDGSTEAVMTDERPVRPQSAAHDDEEYARARLQTLARRRKAAEAAALAAENAASDAATRASAAIAAAARAAQEAEAAADEAARAAEEAAEALEAEQQAATQVKAVITGAQPPAPRAPSDRPTPPRRQKQPPPPPADPPTRHAAREEPGIGRDDDSVPTSRMPAVQPSPLAVTGPAAGRRARRRVQEVAREASRDPATEIITVRQRAEKSPAVAGKDEEPKGKRRWSLPSFGRPGRVTPAVLAAIGVGLVLAMAVVLTTFMGNSQEPAAAAVVGVAPPTSAVEAAPASATRPAVDPKSKKATAFLAAMRRGGIPVSNSGLPETEAAAVICEQLEQGAKEDTLVRSVPAVLPTVTKAQSGDVVRLAKQHYC